MERNTSSPTITAGLCSASDDADTYLKCFVTKSPLEAMAQRFGHVVREFQINLPPQINNGCDSLQYSSSFTTFQVNPNTTTSSSLIYPYFTSIPTLHYHNATTTTTTTTTTTIATSTVIGNILQDGTANTTSKLPLFLSKLCETDAISENLSNITSFNAMKQKSSQESSNVNYTNDMNENSSDPFVSPYVEALNSIQHSSHEKQNLRNPFCTKSNYLDSFHANPLNKTCECEFHSFLNEPTNYGLNLSFPNDKTTHRETSCLNFENCHHNLISGSNNCDMSNSNNLSMFEYKNRSYPHSLINSNLHSPKSDQTEAYSSLISNNFTEAYNCLTHSVKYPNVSSNIYLNKSVPIYWSSDCNNPNVKPPFSYITLIVSAMNSKLSKKITLNEIYAWIMHTFAYYRKNTRRWQNSIRHALSFNDCFIKVPRPSGEAGKGSYWTVHPLAIDMFDNGSSMRRNRKFIDENRYRHNHNHMNEKKLSSIKNSGMNLLNHHPPPPLQHHHSHHESQINMNKDDNDQLSIIITNNDKQNDLMADYSNPHDQHHHNEDTVDIDGYINSFTKKMKQSTIYNNDNNMGNNNSNYKDDYIKTITMLNQIKSPCTIENSWKNLSSDTLDCLNDRIQHICGNTNNINSNNNSNHETSPYLPHCSSHNYQKQKKEDLNVDENYSRNDYKCDMVLSSSSSSSLLSSCPSSCSSYSSSSSIATVALHPLPTTSTFIHNPSHNHRDIQCDYPCINHSKIQLTLLNNSYQKSIQNLINSQNIANQFSDNNHDNNNWNLINVKNENSNHTNDNTDYNDNEYSTLNSIDSNNADLLSRNTIKWYEEFALNQIF